MVSPYWSHKNPKYFPDPDTFNPVSLCINIYHSTAYMCSINIEVNFQALKIQYFKRSLSCLNQRKYMYTRTRVTQTCLIINHSNLT